MAPPKEDVGRIPVVPDDQDDSYATYKDDGKDNTAKRSNPKENVGGTAKDGGVSTEATVMDGGPDDGKEDKSYKPS